MRRAVIHPAGLGVSGLMLLFAVSCASPAAAPASAPADLTGQWALTMDPDFYGVRSTVECNLKQAGDAFTIKCGATGEEMQGTVTGSKATWSFSRTGVHPLPADRVVLTYTGTVSDAGATLKGTWRLKSSVVNEKGNFEARRK